ncbi:MAG: acyl-CoA/acyl-ACP dehydrogenase [Planctomycetaceae bacterium]|nr:acyl-CoA/acyl-ACP dehydrogenase [Planctomycetaceae bacterium]
MNSLLERPEFSELLEVLRSQSCPDRVDAWPADQLAALADAGVLRWDVPEEFGGVNLDAESQTEGLRLLSSACLLTTFILTQRSAAVRRIATSPNETVRRNLLPKLLSGDTFATVGISHLTTSGQHLRTPRVQAQTDGEDYVLSGLVPWATGATKADFLVTGGTLTDGRQILVAIPREAPGMDVLPPVPLMALNASQTGAVRLTDVRIPGNLLLHGPVEGVMNQGTGGGAGSVGTSALAIGASTGMLRQLHAEAESRPDLRPFADAFQAECDRLTQNLRDVAAGRTSDPQEAAGQLRTAANSLVLRTAQAWLAATKGAGYVSGHPADRAVRESMFFLVWSCPQPVLAANIRELACGLLTEPQ